MKMFLLFCLGFVVVSILVMSQQKPYPQGNPHSREARCDSNKFYEALGIQADDVEQAISRYRGCDVPLHFEISSPQVENDPDDWQIIGAFPDGFLWGVAIAAHQVEGNNTNNDWWQFETYADGEWEAVSGKFPKFVRNSGRATDHYALFLDSDLMRAKSLGSNTLRMSIEWSRIEPKRGVFSEEATLYYRQYLKKIRDLGMEPMVTLWHFTLPVWVQRPGCYYDENGNKHDEMEHSLKGWQNPEVAVEFAKFAAYCSQNFGDLVDIWVTHNEPPGNIMVGYMSSYFPPGYILNWDGTKAALLNLARAHNRAYDMICQNDRTDADGDGRPALIGLVQHFRKFIANNPKDPDDLASQISLDYFYHYHMLDAAIQGKLDTNWDGKAKLDFVGVNYYSTFMVCPKYAVNLPFFVANSFPELGNCPWIPNNDSSNVPHNSLGWEIHPQGIYETILRVHKRYGLPIYVTENGMSDADGTTYKRSRYIISHLQMMLKAMREGADIRGYYLWTLTDNFEWREGFSKESRFGLYKVDVDKDDVSLSFHSLSRIPTPAVSAFTTIIRDNGVSLSSLRQYGSFPDILKEENGK